MSAMEQKNIDHFILDFWVYMYSLYFSSLFLMLLMQF